MRGGARPGSEAKCSSLSGWIWVRLSSGGSAPGRATVNEKRPGDRATHAHDDGDALALGQRRVGHEDARRGCARTARMRPRCSPLLAPTTRTDAMRPAGTPSTLIPVFGDASGVPGAGEIVSRPAAPAGAGPASEDERGGGGGGGGGGAEAPGTMRDGERGRAAGACGHGTSGTGGDERRRAPKGPAPPGHPTSCWNGCQLDCRACPPTRPRPSPAGDA